MLCCFNFEEKFLLNSMTHKLFFGVFDWYFTGCLNVTVSGFWHDSWWTTEIIYESTHLLQSALNKRMSLLLYSNDLIKTFPLYFVYIIPSIFLSFQNEGFKQQTLFAFVPWDWSTRKHSHTA